MQVILYDDFGDEQDVTEQVKELYNYMTNTQDWGSGFLSTEEQFGILEFGLLLGLDSEIDDAVNKAEIEYRHYMYGLDRAKLKPLQKENIPFYEKTSAEKKLAVKKLEELRAKRDKIKAMSDDVTNFDEETGDKNA